MNLRFFLKIGFLLFNLNTFAQQQDFEIWSEISASKKITKKIAILATEELRFNRNASNMDEWHNTIGFQYKLNNNFRIRAKYRYTVKNTLKKGTQKSNRYLTDVIYRDKIKRFVLRYRLRYQIDYINLEGLSVDAQMLRNKLSVKYDIRKMPLAPFVSYEFFTNLTSVYGNTFERHRFTGGLDYGFTDYLSTSIYYRYHTKQGLYIDAKNVYILGVSLSFEF